MDLLYAMRDLGVADPAADSTGEETVRAAAAGVCCDPQRRVGFGPGLLDL